MNKEAAASSVFLVMYKKIVVYLLELLYGMCTFTYASESHDHFLLYNENKLM